MLSIMEIEEMKERERLQTIRESFTELATSETQKRFIGHLETWKLEEKHNQGHRTVSYFPFRKQQGVQNAWEKAELNRATS